MHEPETGTPEAEGSPGPFARLLHRLADDPRVYDLIQAGVGYPKVAARVRAALASTNGRILDVGAGTGATNSLLAPSTTYIWFDYDQQKLRGFRARAAGAGLAVIGDAQRLPFQDRSIDAIVMVDVSHHLDDEMLRLALAEAARVTRGWFVFVDALRHDSARSRLLWRYDAGAMPRELSHLRRLIDEAFTVEREETFRVLHDYVLYRARPRDAVS